jgi:hypothetical protein
MIKTLCIIVGAVYAVVGGLVVVDNLLQQPAVARVADIAPPHAPVPDYQGPIGGMRAFQLPEPTPSDESTAKDMDGVAGTKRAIRDAALEYEMQESASDAVLLGKINGTARICISTSASTLECNR